MKCAECVRNLQCAECLDSFLCVARLKDVEVCGAFDGGAVRRCLKNVAVCGLFEVLK